MFYSIKYGQKGLSCELSPTRSPLQERVRFISARPPIVADKFSFRRIAQQYACGKSPKNYGISPLKSGGASRYGFACFPPATFPPLNPVDS